MIKQDGPRLYKTHFKTLLFLPLANKESRSKRQVLSKKRRIKNGDCARRKENRFLIKTSLDFAYISHAGQKPPSYLKIFNKGNKTEIKIW